MDERSGDRRVLILGGTREARELAEKLSGESGFEVVSSLAGRVREPVLPVGEVRIGGFGGVDGLRGWLRDNDVDVLIDATHPFAGVISAHAAEAAAALNLPALHVHRPGWRERPGDRWIRVPDVASAVETVGRRGSRIFLTIGRQEAGAFAGLTRPWFLIRSIDPPSAVLPPHHELILARGPFAVDDEVRLLTDRRIDILVTKNSGGELTVAKVLAARACGLPVVMIDRPPLPEGARVAESVAAAWDWLRTLP
ncbi:cobalt-precorrin-6A reductase [Nocardia miyunensis]|uniref:cobalt-precorrin-6A reductase n=1 Tax=Nocardia miyunensis TaxID=282684 RepID=UPI0008349DED|nr:cobalt-precorrin-6A reductase [Nocardia miyunensis]